MRTAIDGEPHSIAAGDPRQSALDADAAMDERRAAQSLVRVRT